MTMLSCRLPEEQVCEVRRRAEQMGVAVSDLVREAVRLHLLKLDSEDDARTWERLPPTEEELSLAEVADWGPAEDWSDWADEAR